MIKNLPAVQETQVQSLEILLEKGMATHSSILAWRIKWKEEPGGPHSMGSQRVRQVSSNLPQLSVIYLLSAALNMPANLENSVVATGMEVCFFIPIPKKGNAKECSNYRTVALISLASKVMLQMPLSRFSST